MLFSLVYWLQWKRYPTFRRKTWRQKWWIFSIRSANFKKLLKDCSFSLQIQQLKIIWRNVTAPFALPEHQVRYRTMFHKKSLSCWKKARSGRQNFVVHAYKHSTERNNSLETLFSSAWIQPIICTLWYRNRRRNRMFENELIERGIPKRFQINFKWTNRHFLVENLNVKKLCDDGYSNPELASHQTLKVNRIYISEAARFTFKTFGTLDTRNLLEASISTLVRLRTIISDAVRNHLHGNATAGVCTGENPSKSMHGSWVQVETLYMKRKLWVANEIV